MPATLRPKRFRRKSRDLVRATSLIPIAAAREVTDEASRWLGTILPGRFAARLALQACRIYAHSESFRRKLNRPGNIGRDCLWCFMRHWLAARLQAERPDLYHRLPPEYAMGADLPQPPMEKIPSGFEPLSPDARLLAC